MTITEKRRLMVHAFAIASAAQLDVSRTVALAHRVYAQLLANQIREGTA